MRAAILLFALAGCGDNWRPAAEHDASIADDAEVIPDAAPNALAPCLDSPAVRAPNGQLPCDLLPPGFAP